MEVEFERRLGGRSIHVVAAGDVTDGGAWGNREVSNLQIDCFTVNAKDPNDSEPISPDAFTEKEWAQLEDEAADRLFNKDEQAYSERGFDWFGYLAEGCA